MCRKDRKRQGSTDLIKSSWDRDGWELSCARTRTSKHAHIPWGSRLLCQGVTCIIYLHNHLPFRFLSSLSVGKPVMIITEYMENGSLDAFLRVSHAFLSLYTCLFGHIKILSLQCQQISQLLVYLDLTWSVPWFYWQAVCHCFFLDLVQIHWIQSLQKLI